MTSGTLKAAAKVAMAVVAAGLTAACGGGSSHAKGIGPAGGTVSAAGVTVRVPAGALSSEVQIEVTDLSHDATGHKVHLGPDGLTFAKPVSIAMVSDDGNAADEKMVEIEHGAENEVEVQIENEHEVEAEHGREVEVEHLGEFELRPAKVCAPVCSTGTHCDDGVCKPNL